ncbi:MAG: tyrosine-type recombinase/integrase [Lactobacillaceae bacterium]|uniref:tyrosine-type recombinase/integrase n=1 Tax=Limosilactobacillus sp. TaxID=2773925 RepID=UPI002A75B33F|nr:tyrosine-type recombinase/integrase [Limosilactobacillus sp.]MDD7692833.1 tyrosine-type recombinase/integrase [Lactobacillaceae bacterium]MDY2802792.1 tyrosine-type recombinase/integrase [Limosilactobacillus sp.]
MMDEITAFTTMLKNERGLAVNTRDNYRRDLVKAKDFFTQQGVTTWQAVDRYAVMDFLTAQQQAGKSVATINRLISSLRQFFHYLVRQQQLVANPMETIDHRPASAQLASPVILTEEEVDRLLAVPDTTTPLGIRDRAILELLDATGMRVTELATLPLTALHLDIRFVQLQGNAQHERMVPLGRPTVQWLERYLKTVRPQLVDGDQTAVFLNAHGRPLTRQGIWKNFRKWVQQADITKQVTPQTFRYTLAVQMLSRGASGQVVQEMLGYTELRMLRPYLKVTPQELTATYEKYHPRA